MDPELLKREFGDSIVFWGGLDIQKILPYGTPEQISTEVGRLMEIFGVSGGYVFAPSHNIQPTVPVKNVKAMFDAAVKFR